MPVALHMITIIIAVTTEMKILPKKDFKSDERERRFVFSTTNPTGYL